MSRAAWLLPLMICALLPAWARADVDRRIQVEGRGPLHEAFAQRYEANPSANPSINQEPPAPVTEEPPDERPKGTNVQWIPGYWQWDDQKRDFVWVSGFWRDMPNGRRWVPGFWANTPQGFRWVPGHWAGAQERDFQFVETPPFNPDRGPNAQPPDADSFYIPGTWFYGNSGYFYRDGYWAACRPGLVWVPARYFWTPYGWAFTSGYWDFVLGARGLLYAPVTFPGGAYVTTGFIFQPFFALSFGVFSSSLFIRTGHSHYYFGDYYARSALGHGFQPWVSHSTSSFDPMFANERWVNRNNPNWIANQQSVTAGRLNGTQPVPARTLADQAKLAGSANTAMLASANQLRNSGVRFEPLTTAQRTQQVQNAQQMLARTANFGRVTGPNSGNDLSTSFRMPIDGVRSTSIATGGMASPRMPGGSSSMQSLHAPVMSGRPSFSGGFHGGGGSFSGGRGGMGGSIGGGHGGGGHR